MEAVAAIRAGRTFDVVLMDMMMPVMSGVEATHEIRAMGHTQLPILAMVRGFDAMGLNENRLELKEGTLRARGVATVLF